jgi:hypothetical protein
MVNVLAMAMAFLIGSRVLVAPYGAEGRGGSPLDKMLPAVTGTNLAGAKVTLPDDLRGKPSVLLVAYRRGTQADVDRWISFVSQTMPGLTFLEVPTIANPVWRPLAGWIDGGMKRGVSQERWHQVVTLYEDAPILKDFLGDRGGHATHVVLLDDSGRVRWFYAGGFTEASAADFQRTAGDLFTAEHREVPPR